MPIDVNKETLDFLRSELAASVRKEAEDSIFRSYRNFAAAAFTVLGALGITIGWSYLPNMVDRLVKDGVARNAEQPIKDAVERANQAQKGLETVSADARSTIKLIEYQLENMTNNIRETQKLLTSARNSVNESVVGLNEQVAEIKLKIADLNASFDQRSSKNEFTYASQDSVKSLSDQVTKLATQVGTIDTALKPLAQSLGRTPDTAAVQAQLQTLQSLSATVQAQVQSIVANPVRQNVSVSKPTLFVQFVGGTRDQMVSVTNILRNGGDFTVPAEESTKGAVGQHEIRYFYPEDKADADKAQAAVNAALAEKGLRIARVTLQPMLDYPKKPPRGVFELWLDLTPPASAQ